MIKKGEKEIYFFFFVIFFFVTFFFVAINFFPLNLNIPFVFKNKSLEYRLLVSTYRHEHSTERYSICKICYNATFTRRIRFLERGKSDRKNHFNPIVISWIPYPDIYQVTWASGLVVKIAFLFIEL